MILLDGSPCFTKAEPNIPKGKRYADPGHEKPGLRQRGEKVIADSPSQKIDIADGKARGVLTESDEYYQSDLIVSNAHVQTTMMKLVGREHLDASLYTKVENIQVGNGFVW